MKARQRELHASTDSLASLSSVQLQQLPSNMTYDGWSCIFVCIRFEK
jgi:hypothetical protein